MMEDFKRPDHPDFMDSIELSRIGFSGIRSNSLTHYMEIWIDGVRRFEMSIADYQNNPEKFQKEYADLFGLHNVEVVNTKGN